MYYLIYKIVNTVNGKVYIGKHKTTKIEDNYFGSGGAPFQRALKKYGVSAFKKEVLYLCDDEESMTLLEEMIVDHAFVSRTDTYNVRIGGDGGWAPTDRLKALEAKTLIGNEELNNRTKQTKKLRYGDENFHNKSKERNTKKERYGDPNYNNPIKRKTTNIERYGVDNPFKLEEVKKKIQQNRKKPDYKGENNPRARKYYLISPTGDQFTVIGGLREFCKSYSISFNKIRENIDKGIIRQGNHYKSSFPQTPESKNTIGWSCSTTG